MEVTGILKVKGTEVKVSEKFTRRDLVLTVEPSSQYPQQVSFQLSQERVDLLDPYNVGEEVKVHFNLRGREWTDPKTNIVKYFNTLEAWRIRKVTATGTTTEGTAAPVEGTETAAPGAALAPADDLPF